jgi:hypothetical protein
MPSMKCSCGHTFSTGSFPNPNAFMVVSEVDYDELGEIEEVNKLDQLLFASSKMYECQKCGELILVPRNGAEPTFYKKH